MSTIDLIDVKGKKSGSIDLPASIFDVQTNVPLIHQVVVPGTFRSHIGNSESRGTKSEIKFAKIADLVPKTYPNRQNRISVT